MNEFSNIPPIDRKTYRFRAPRKSKPEEMKSVTYAFHLSPETMQRIENYAKRQRIPKSHALERMLQHEALHHIEPPVTIDWKRKFKMDRGEYFLSFDPGKLKRQRRKKTP